MIEGNLTKKLLTSSYYDFMDVAFQRYLKENPKAKMSEFKKNDIIKDFFKKSCIGDKLEWYVWDDILMPNAGLQLTRNNKLIARIALTTKI